MNSMTDWRQIAIELYRDGMPKQLIREKLEMSASELNAYLVGIEAPAKDGRPAVKISEAKRIGLNLLGKGLPTKEVHKRLKSMGYMTAEATVKNWRQQVSGPTNKRVNAQIVREIMESMPEARGRGVARLYTLLTGEQPSRQAIGYWVKKLREAA